MLRASFSVFACLVLLGQSIAGGATTIYKSVDADGRVTFSDQPPAFNALVDVIEYNAPPANTSALDRERIEAMRETTDRMAADRREREASRYEARAAAAAARQQYQEPFYYGVSDGYWPVTLPRRPNRPGYGRPPHVRPPIVRPPHDRLPEHRLPEHRLPEQLTAGFNHYPASLVRRHYTGVARRVFYRQPPLGHSFSY